MIEFFSQVGKFFESIFNFAKMLITGLLTLITMIPKGLAFLTEAIAHLPPLLTTFALASVMIAVIYFIIGRQNE